MKQALATLLWAGPRASQGAPPVDAIARALGARRWLSLSADVRRRFAAHDPVVFRGSTETKFSPIGRVFAWCLAFIGAPLPPFAGHADAAVEVSPVVDGMSWARLYRGPFGIAFAVRSIKRLAEDGRLLECCTGGWTMLLDLSVEDGVLIFRSRQFFWRLGAISIPFALPLTPGRAEIRHEDLGSGRFRFSLTFDHPWFGRTLEQTGVFDDPAQPP
jgi:hypothetical protein